MLVGEAMFFSASEFFSVVVVVVFRQLLLSSDNKITATSSQVELKILCNSWEVSFAIKLNLQRNEK